MSRASSVIVALLMLCAVTAPRSARADFPSPSLYIGVDGGAMFRLRGWDLGDSTTQYPGGKGEGQVGLRLGMHLLPQLALEGELAYVPLLHRGDRNTLLAYDLNLLFHFMKGNWSPTAAIGFGAYSTVKGNLGKDTDPRLHVGLGVRGLVTSWMALRIDVRDVISDGFDNGGSNNIEVLGGIDFFVWGGKPAVKPADRDGDGIPDVDDACPDEAGPAATKGCPDRDGDGIPDKDDACPDQAGPAATKGCPDRDGDGIPDKDDRCPDQAGPAALKGCPDRDGDGIPDKDDACPDQAGPAELKGCPDRDKDGIPDKDDRCPDQAGPAELQGCPDRDGDGVPDIDDKCPDQPGLKQYQGCLPEKAKKFTGSIKGINFATGSAKILPNSFKVLDGAVAVLKEFPTMRIRIEGHTDNVGKPDKNQALSENRANAVRDYFVKKGIDASRLEAKGYGEAKPVQDNKTAAGRAANRRIEFHVRGMK
jgi:outer membrane protein OmpA-like peptidoglycan-associated protein